MRKLRYYYFLAFFLTLIIFVFSPLALGEEKKASLLIEPFLGLGVASYGLENKAPSAGELLNRKRFTSLAFGGKIGYGVRSFTFGLEVFKAHVLGEIEDFTLKNLRKEVFLNPLFAGVFLNSKIPLFFDIYGTLFFSHIKNQELSYIGPVVKIGLGLVKLFWVKMNIEFIYSRYFCFNSCAQFNAFYGFLSFSVPLRHKFKNEKPK